MAVRQYRKATRPHHRPRSDAKAQAAAWAFALSGKKSAPVDGSAMYAAGVRALDGPHVMLLLALVLLFSIGTGPLVFLALWKAHRRGRQP
jgi:hypothetical protein